MRQSCFYPVIDAEICARHGVAPMDVAAACLRGGARLLQLRVKGGASGAFLALATSVVALARPFDAAVIINDRADIAKMAGAAGVHVGQEDMPPAAVRAVLGAEAVVGLSTHDAGQVDRAVLEPVTYVAVGPVFGTTTKDTGYSARGLELVHYASAKGKPVVAIGGITVENGAAVLEAGAASLAVIADVLTDDDPETRTRRFLSLQPGAP